MVNCFNGLMIKTLSLVILIFSVVSSFDCSRAFSSRHESVVRKNQNAGAIFSTEQGLPRRLRTDRKSAINRKVVLAMGDNVDDNDLGLKKIRIGDRDFWTRQKELAESLSDKAEKNLKEEQMEKYNQRQIALVGDTVFFSILIFFVLWGLFDNPFFPLSYVFGSVFGLAYVYGLGKYVATLGGSVDDANNIEGAGVGQARFAFLILLFVLVGKLRGYGLLEIPSIMGFFTYQLATLSQGLREIND